MKKRWISILLVLLLILSVLPLGALAYKDSGNATTDYTTWKQTNTQWASASPWSNNSAMFGDIGCYITSVAILLRHFNVVTDADLDLFNPLICNDAMMAVEAVNNDGDLIPANVSRAYPGFAYVNTEVYSLDRLKALVDEGYACIVQVLNDVTGRTHFVAIRSVSGSTVTMMDPGSSATDLTAQYSTINNINYYRVTAPSSTDIFSISGHNYPTELAPGASFSISGTVSSAESNLTSLTVGVYDSTGIRVTGATATPNAKSYNLANLDSQIKFGSLKSGNYTYRVMATNGSNTKTVLAKKFTVTTDSLAITDYNYPTTLEQGQSFSIKGVVTSEVSNIASLTIGVYDVAGNMKTGVTVRPGTKTYNLQNADAHLSFGSLAVGTYTYLITAENSTEQVTLVDKTFTVADEAAAADPVTISDYTYPTTLKQGEAFHVRGTVSSTNSNITSLTVGVYDTADTQKTGTTVSPNAKTYDLQNVDDAVAISKLEVGTYTYRITATNGAGTWKLVDETFTVTGEESDLLTIDNYTYPTTLKQGSTFSVRGTVTSERSNITSLTVGVYDAAGTMATGKTVSPNALQYNLQNVDSSVSFGSLVAGTYHYRVIATNAAGTTTLLDKEFTVTAEGSDALTITDYNYPTTLKYGESFSIRGLVTSESSNITSLSAAIYDTADDLKSSLTVNPNKTSYYLEDMVGKLAFSSMSPGTYYYRVVATNAAGAVTLLNQKFTVTSESYSADTLTITDYNYPTALDEGQSFSIRGTVTSKTSNITSLTVGVYDASNNQKTGKTVSPNAKTYDLQNVDAYISFGSLAAGTYNYRVSATNGAGTTTLVDKQFTVGGGTTTVTTATLTISDYTYPIHVVQGNPFKLRGTVNSTDSNITSLTVGVYNTAGNLVTGSTVNPGAASYNIRNVDGDISFGGLSNGTYVYKISATNAEGTKLLVSKEFTVSSSGSNRGDYGSSIPFTDVQIGEWFYDAVEYAYYNGIMNGMTETTFEPYTNMNRAMMVTAVYRLAGSPAVSGSNSYSDVADDSWYTNAIIWATQNGIVNGVGDGLFAPNDSVTRQQLIAVIYRYANHCGYDTGASASLSGYQDAGAVQDYAKDAFCWGVAKGIITGTSETTLDPTGTATRAQIATILMRFYRAYILGPLEVE